MVECIVTVRLSVILGTGHWRRSDYLSPPSLLSLFLNVLDSSTHPLTHVLPCLPPPPSPRTPRPPPCPRHRPGLLLPHPHRPSHRSGGPCQPVHDPRTRPRRVPDRASGQARVHAGSHLAIATQHLVRRVLDTRFWEIKTGFGVDEASFFSLLTSYIIWLLLDVNLFEITLHYAMHVRAPQSIELCVVCDI